MRSWVYHWGALGPRLGLVVGGRRVVGHARGWLVAVVSWGSFVGLVGVAVAVAVDGQGVVVRTWLGLHLMGDGLVERVVGGGGLDLGC